MKISEIKNKMFNLSDLKGLINENVATENMSWKDFFETYPQFLDDKYDFQSSKDFFDDEELMQALSNFKGSTYTYLRDPEERKGLSKDKKANAFGKNQFGFRPNWRKYRELRTQEPKAQIDSTTCLTGDSTDGLSAEQNNTRQIYNFFMNNGGQSLAYSDEFETNESAMKSYVDACWNLANAASEYFTANGNQILKRFDTMDLKVGSVREPFLLFLYFYYVKYADNRGGSWGRGVSNKDAIYQQNIEPCAAGEYTKYLANALLRTKNNKVLMPNVFDTILQYGKAAASGGKIYNGLVNNGLNRDELTYARSMAYSQKYQEILSFSISPEEINFIATAFDYDPGRIFDPLSNIQDVKVMQGIQKLCADGNPDTLNRFIRPSLTEKDEFKSPAEQIFSMVRAFRNVLSIDFGKVVGASGRNVLGDSENMSPEKMQLLLGPASIGITKLEEEAASRGYFGVRTPQAINGLKELYLGEIKKSEDLRLWQIFRRETDTKTQDEIFNFLLGISDADTEWEQEYNRFDKQAVEKEEGGLGLKSIDIMGKKRNETGGEKVLCFEYQGEQHYHPVNVRPSDYQYTLFNAMREDILTKCGFRADETEGRKYYYGFEKIDELFVKTVIIDTFKEYAKALQAALNERGDIKGKVISRKFSLVAEGASVKSVNVKALTTLTIEEALDYFIEIASKNPHNATVFENPPLKGVIPYLCSPCRFLDEIKTALDIERDRVKREAIRKKSVKSGWGMAYVTPKIADTNSSPFTTEDYEYTLRLAGDGAAVFQWSPEGKEEMAQYLERMGFRTPELNAGENELQENISSLFQEIVREIINENVR